MSIDDHFYELGLTLPEPMQTSTLPFELTRLDGQVLYGASPRASMGIDRAARAHAWLAGRDYVGPEDIQDVAPDVLRHRVLLTYEAEADGLTPDAVVERVRGSVPTP